MIHWAQAVERSFNRSSDVHLQKNMDFMTLKSGRGSDKEAGSLYFSRVIHEYVKTGVKKCVKKRVRLRCRGMKLTIDYIFSKNY